MNRLALESSPYLRQHSSNPVDWYPWGDEAFAEAQRLHRPIFLSVGYSTCHWCHVMERESFEDEGIAAFLNTHYVAVKVDREERPDIDAVYMRAAQMIMNGGGGWPLSLWLTETGEPFFAGTYFPPRAGMRGAGAGFLEILSELVRIYQEDPAQVHGTARMVSAAVREGLDGRSASRQPSHALAIASEGPPLISAAVRALQRNFDEQNGGLRVRQKFPSQVPVRLLLRHYQQTGDGQALHMAVSTLDAMAAGGIYDHLGGGFHRYATDPAWRVPHFEKMLYDNAQLVVAYLEAWQVTGRAAYARVAAETCDALLATFASPEGGFYAATDADSEGEEGKYFVWSEEEIRSLLDSGADADAFLHYYNLASASAFDGRGVLFEAAPDEDTRQSLAPARAKLLRARARRVPPFRDEKILAAWNGLAISALAVAGRVLGVDRYLEVAARAAEFVLTGMRDASGNLLVRSFHAERLSGPGFLDDHAFVTAGLLDLFESTGDAQWFFAASELAEKAEHIFADPETGGWFTTGLCHERLFGRERPAFDGAEPAGGSVALMNAARLAALTDSETWRNVVERALAVYWPTLQEHPLGLAETLLAVDFLAGPVREIALVRGGGEPPRADALSRVLRTTYCPRKVLVAGDAETPAWKALAERIPLLRDKTARDGRATAYVCTAGTCHAPTHDPETLRTLLCEPNH